MKKKIIDFIPCFVATAASAVCLLIYFFAFHKSYYLDVVKACMVPICALVIPLVNLIFKIRVPFAFNIAVAVFAFCGLDLASVLGFYDYTYYDKFLHTTFGIVGAFGVMIVLLYGKGERMKPWCFFLVILLCVLGIAALWEIFEYAVHAVTGSDTQHWTPIMSEAGNMTVEEFFADYDPLWDTIWDIIVAAIGVFMFYGIIFIDKLCKYKMCRGIYRQVNFRSVPTAQEENKEGDESGQDNLS